VFALLGLLLFGKDEWAPGMNELGGMDFATFESYRYPCLVFVVLEQERLTCWVVAVDDMPGINGHGPASIEPFVCLRGRAKITSAN